MIVIDRKQINFIYNPGIIIHEISIFILEVSIFI